MLHLLLFLPIYVEPNSTACLSTYKEKTIFGSPPATISIYVTVESLLPT